MILDEGKIEQKQEESVPEQIQIQQKTKLIRKRRVQVVSLPRHFLQQDIYSAVFDGDIFVQIPRGYSRQPFFQSDINLYKKVSQITINKKYMVKQVLHLKIIDTFLSDVHRQKPDTKLFLHLLSHKNDAVTHQLSQLLSEYSTRTQIYKQNLNLQKDLPILQSTENYRISINDALDQFLSKHADDAFFMFRFVFDPSDKQMHLGSVAYNEVLLKILGITTEQYIMIVKKYGTIQNLHPQAHIRFMIDALLNQFGRRKGVFFGDLDIITFDEICLPLTIGRYTFQAKPNDDGYQETFFLFQCIFDPKTLECLDAKRRMNESGTQGSVSLFQNQKSPIGKVINEKYIQSAQQQNIN